MPDTKQDNRQYPGWFIQRMADNVGDIRRTPTDEKGMPHAARRQSPPAPGDRARTTVAPVGREKHRRIVRGTYGSGARGSSGQMHQLSSTNIYGLTSRSEQFYPTAYKPLEDRYWNDLSEIERNELARMRIDAMRKVTYREEFEGLPRSLNAADESYELAISRRRQAMRRRKPRGYEERKKWEEERRKAPLVRKYVYRELSHLEPTAFYKPGALDTPVLIESQIIGQTKKKKQDDPPKRLKVQRMKKLIEQKRQETLPVSQTAGRPNVGITSNVNNPYGLKSRSVSQYPEAYQTVSSVFYQQMSKEDRQKVMRVQAQAMEKVGFEPKSSKFFIDDFDPMQENLYASTGWGTGGEAPSDNQHNPYDSNVSLQNRFSSQQFEPVRDKRDNSALLRGWRYFGGSALIVAALYIGFVEAAPGGSIPMGLAGLACLIFGLVLVVGDFD